MLLMGGPSGFLELVPLGLLSGLAPASQGAGPSLGEKGRLDQSEGSDPGYRISGLLIDSPCPAMVADSGQSGTGRCEAESARSRPVPYFFFYWVVNGFQTLAPSIFAPAWATWASALFASALLICREMVG